MTVAALASFVPVAQLKLHFYFITFSVHYIWTVADLLASKGDLHLLGHVQV